ncbi:MAG: squalene synthase HpnC [Burkholderiales bacterium]|nr:squalene synthase HpnC [Burkholderiales bacterium]
MSVGHYENFPVASWLCPAALRPPIRAIYAFARTADDLADEGDASPDERVAKLQHYRRCLHAMHAGRASTDWPQVFNPLAQACAAYALPIGLLDDLLDAFIQDCGNPHYPDRAALLDYCRRSANPIGRLLLHLYRIDDASAIRQSDAICSALQLINFWQDLSVDLLRGRVYLPRDDANRHGLALDGLPTQDRARQRAMVRELCQWAGTLMREGAPLVHRLPGRIGLELRLVVQGGLRILERIERMQFDTFDRRPVLTARDGPVMLWRALRMTPGRTAP